MLTWSTATWKSAENYTGPVIWQRSAKAVVAATALLVASLILYGGLGWALTDTLVVRLDKTQQEHRALSWIVSTSCVNQWVVRGAHAGSVEKATQSG